MMARARKNHSQFLNQDGDSHPLDGIEDQQQHHHFPFQQLDGSKQQHQLLYKSAPASSSSRFWLILFIAFVGAFFLLPSLSSVLLYIPGSQRLQAYHSALNLQQEDDFTLGGLISSNAEREKCKSRGIIHRYRPKSAYSPSPYLVKKLRDYEALHSRCGPATKEFNESVNCLMKSDCNIEEKEECKYIVFIANSGLGNRLISIASAFVYALLTGRLLVIDGKSDISELLCEPFPGDVSWVLPGDFPPFESFIFNGSSPHRFGLHLEQGTIMSFRREPPEMDKKPPSSAISTPSPHFSYVHLMHDYDFFDKLFFCDKEQATLQKIPWIFLKTNLYFLPSMYIYLPEFREELDLLFPNRETIFHHVARYLFFPTNAVWSWITRYYDAYLAKASQVVGIQVRTFAFPPVVEPYLSKQILTCAINNGLLPKVLEDKAEDDTPASMRNTTGVLVTSLLPDYSEQIKEFYGDHPTETGDVVSVHQPSHEGHQNTEAHGHNIKAWGEMCLLSFSDNLITSPMSTFGYIAVGLSGKKPLILAPVESDRVASPPCSRALSLDPCFHAPPYYKCDRNEGGDTSQVLPYVKHCEDVSWGLKLLPVSS